MKPHKPNPIGPEIKQQIDNEFLCEHANSHLSRRTLSNGEVRIVKQCVDCGQQIGDAIKRATLSEVEFKAIKEWDAELCRTFHSRRHKRREDVYRAKAAEYDAIVSKKYNEYLASESWKQKRKLVMKRANGICEGCLTAPAEDVHHHSYDNIGEEFMFELSALCRSCHTRLHARWRDVS